MEKCGKFQVKDIKSITLGKTPHFPLKLPQITMWIFHKAPEVSAMVRQVKYQMGHIKSSELPQVKYGKYHGKPLVAAPKVKYKHLELTWRRPVLLPVVNRNLPKVNPQNSPDAAPKVKILCPGKASLYLRTTLGNSTIDLRKLPEGIYGNSVVICGKVRT